MSTVIRPTRDRAALLLPGANLTDLVDPAPARRWASTWLYPLTGPEQREVRGAWAAWIVHGGNARAAAITLDRPARTVADQVETACTLIDPDADWVCADRARGWLALAATTPTRSRLLRPASITAPAERPGWWRLLVDHVVAAWASERLAAVLPGSGTDLAAYLNRVAGQTGHPAGPVAVAAWLDTSKCWRALSAELGLTGRHARHLHRLLDHHLGNQAATPGGEYQLRLAADALALR